jgi:hypothetical protein
MTDMVRPDADRFHAEDRKKSICSCTDLAGESPVLVIAGEPGSRLPTSVETPADEAQRREPTRSGEQACGPQRAVNAEQASSDCQPKGVREGRAGHVAAKAKDSTLDPERVLALSGVVAAARTHREARNRRDPSRRSTSDEATHISAEREGASCRAGVRGGRSTGEGDDKSLEGRAPASVTSASPVSVRAWSSRPNTLVSKARERHNRLCTMAKSRKTGSSQREGDDLRGSLRQHPSEAMHALVRRPSVSRVREIRTHGLTGGSVLSPMTSTVNV